jgi:hypothetical protein
VKKIGEGDNEGAEPEYKFEWQRTWGHAPKESYLEKGDDYNEQPFGIQVGNNGVYFPLLVPVHLKVALCSHSMFLFTLSM